MTERTIKVRVRRYDPEADDEGRWQTFAVPAGADDRVLDLLETIRSTGDPTLAFRRSCGQGSCGDDAMRIDGVNRLACTTMVRDLGDEVSVEPVRGLPVARDLIVDMTAFFAAYADVRPWREPTAATAQTPAERDRIADSARCNLCAACTTACPVYDIDNGFVGPAALVAAHRFAFDSREPARPHLDAVDGGSGAWRCRTAYSCTAACPQDIPVTETIQQVKRALLSRHV